MKTYLCLAVHLVDNRHVICLTPLKLPEGTRPTGQILLAESRWLRSDSAVECPVCGMWTERTRTDVDSTARRRRR